MRTPFERDTTLEPRDGLTRVELFVVLLVMAVVLAIAVPVFLGS